MRLMLPFVASDHNQLLRFRMKYDRGGKVDERASNSSRNRIAFFPLELRHTSIT